MIYLQLFLTFLKIGAVSFGGGYGMISLMREECLAAGWLTDDEILNFIAVSESTPGPFAVNMATFVGSSQAGVLGALLATFGMVLPSFVIILLIAAVLKRLLKYKGVQAVLGAVRPAVVGMILATAVIMFLSILFGIKDVNSGFTFDWRSLVIFLVVAVIGVGYSLWKKKTFSPILLIILSGVMGVIFFGV